MESKAKILVVDDEKYICSLIEEMLEDERYSIKTTTDPQKALELLESDPQDLIVTDLVMDVVSGTEILKKAKKIRPESVVILMTGKPTIENAVSVLKSGAYDYLIKPFSLENLKATVQRGLEKFRLYQENIHLKETVSLYRISEAMVSTVELEELLNLILKTAVKELEADIASILLWDPKTKKLKPKAYLGMGPDLLKNEFLVGIDPLSDWVLKNAKPKVFNSNQTHILFKNKKVKSLISHPLLAKGRSIGILNILRKKKLSPFSPGELHSLSILASKAATAIENSRLYENLKEAYLETLTALANAVEARDVYTAGHTERVWYMAESLARQLGWGEDKIAEVRMGSILHDIGKIGVPDAILNKPVSLTLKEFEIMKMHTVQGTKILEGISFLKPALPYVLYHHERYDGKGYPEGLGGEDIPMEGRLMAVIDTFDAITSERPYRKKRDLETAVLEIKRNSGTQFDPFVAEVFVNAWKSKIFDKRRLVIKEKIKKLKVLV